MRRRAPRFKAYRQLERSDCGITCVRMIARYFGKNIPLKELRKLTETNRQGISLQDITDVFTGVGMKSAALSIRPEDLYRMPMPGILYWRQRHFVVLYHIDAESQTFYIADPDEGKLKLSEREFMEYWKGDSERGIVIVVEPGEEFDTMEWHGEGGIGKLLRTTLETLTSKRKVFLSIIALSLLCMGADLLFPLMMQDTVDRGIALKDIGLVWSLVAAQLVVFAGNMMSANVMQYIMAKVGMNLNLDMTRRYLRRLISRPMSFFDCKVPADLIQKIDDQSRIKDFVMQIPGSILFVVLNMIVFSSLLIWYNVWLFVFFIAVTSLEFGWAALFMKTRRELDYASFVGQSENRNTVYETINGMMEIKSSGAHGSRLREWEKNQKKLIWLSLRSRLVGMYMSGGQSFIARVKEIVIIGICATFVIRGSLTLGEMMTVSYLVGRLSGAWQGILGMVSQTQDAMMSNERLEEVMAEDESGKGIRDCISSRIELRNVWFRYPGSSNPYILRGLNLTIAPGTVTAIVGESGCGKTTLIKLMLGFYEPQRGLLGLGGVPISEVDRDKWLSRCGVVMQSGYIFSDSVKGNIALSSSDIDMERVEEAAKASGLHDFVVTLPMGYDTMIGASGLELSGGQKQRLLIARAIYKRSDILFLDEATSSLDAINEKLVTERILQMKRGKTLIVAAHRLSTVKNADRILYMCNGIIAEDGTHEELLALKGFYWRLVSNQLEFAR